MNFTVLKSGFYLVYIILVGCCAVALLGQEVDINANSNITDYDNCTCQLPFEGFGVFLGSVGHFQRAPNGTVSQVLQLIYDDLRIRHFRTSYESEFSQSPHNYSISCETGSFSCTWIEVMNSVSELQNISVFASVWSPPLYMKNEFFDSLLEEKEQDFHWFVRNITDIIKTRWGIQIERVSPINEPENLFAPWEHTNMGPYQMCKMVREFNDPLLRLCPENSYYWMTELYSNYTDDTTGVNCSAVCDIYATHAYTLNIDFFSSDYLLAYYDPGRYLRFTTMPIWMTEVSSTFGLSDTNQMQEALDLGTNIVNFVGSTCVQRYYFWYMFTNGASGESLIWGYDPITKMFNLPKKYFVFKHFTLASSGGNKTVSECHIVNPNSTEYTDGESGESNEQDGQRLCLSFSGGNKESIVIVNKERNHYLLEGIKCKKGICCTSEEFNWFCVEQDRLNPDLIIPKRSVCSCKIHQNLSRDFLSRHYRIIVNATIYTNHVPN